MSNEQNNSQARRIAVLIIEAASRFEAVGFNCPLVEEVTK